MFLAVADPCSTISRCDCEMLWISIFLMKFRYHSESSNCFHPISHIYIYPIYPIPSHFQMFHDVSRCLSSRGVPGLPITARPGDDRKEARIAIDIAWQISSVSITSESRIVSVYSFRIVSVIFNYTSNILTNQVQISHIHFIWVHSLFHHPSTVHFLNSGCLTVFNWTY